MYVSKETPAETTQRLQRVLAASKWQIHAGSHEFLEFPLGNAIPEATQQSSLAMVRDDEVWSVLTQATDHAPDAELFALCSFHFPANVDNSGFVGWLASSIKQQTGAGVFVVCGQNSQQGGIFDYWGMPIGMQTEVIAAIKQLRDLGLS